MGRMHCRFWRNDGAERRIKYIIKIITEAPKLGLLCVLGKMREGR